MNSIFPQTLLQSAFKTKDENSVHHLNAALSSSPARLISSANDPQCIEALLSHGMFQTAMLFGFYIHYNSIFSPAIRLSLQLTSSPLPTAISKLCSGIVICYCSIIINLTGSIINLQYQIEAILHIDLLMLLISSGKINFALIAYIGICIYLVKVIYFLWIPFY